MKCYICDKEAKGPEGVIHPAGGFGFRHLTCDPQDHVQKLAKTSSGGADAMFETTKTGDVELSPYGQLITARSAQAVADAQAAATKDGE